MEPWCDQQRKKSTRRISALREMGVFVMFSNFHRLHYPTILITQQRWSQKLWTFPRVERPLRVQPICFKAKRRKYKSHVRPRARTLLEATPAQRKPPVVNNSGLSSPGHSRVVSNRTVELLGPSLDSYMRDGRPVFRPRKNGHKNGSIVYVHTTVDLSVFVPLPVGRQAWAFDPLAS